MRLKIKILDYVMIIISVITIIGLLIYFIAALTPNGEYGTKNYDPFHDYYTNIGIVCLMVLRLILFLSIFIIGIIWVRKKEISIRVINIILVAVISLAIMDWFELWYGSTFYYGEVRDKQGLGFPIFSLLLILYGLSKIRLPKNMYRTGLMIGMILIYFWLYNLVKEPWILDRFYIPGTTIKIF